jgi:hypothetical protein
MGIFGQFVDSVAAAIQTAVAAIKAKTDNLPTHPADNDELGDVQDAVAAVQAKTDHLPASFANQTNIDSASNVINTKIADMFSLDAESPSHPANSGDQKLIGADWDTTIKNIVIWATGTLTADLTSIQVALGATKFQVLITTTQGARANLNGAGKQVSWSGIAVIPGGDQLTITYAGTGSGAVALNAVIEYSGVLSAS